MARPKLISPITPVKPISATNMKYGIRYDPPPYIDTLVGNIQILPIPTAEPIQARMNPHLLLKESRLFINKSPTYILPDSNIVNIQYICGYVK